MNIHGNQQSQHLFIAQNPLCLLKRAPKNECYAHRIPSHTSHLWFVSFRHDLSRLGGSEPYSRLS